jgi:hypothetical protein
MGEQHPSGDQRHYRNYHRCAHDSQHAPSTYRVPARHQCRRQDGSNGHARTEQQAVGEEVQRIARGKAQHQEAEQTE